MRVWIVSHYCDGICAVFNSFEGAEKHIASCTHPDDFIVEDYAVYTL